MSTVAEETQYSGVLRDSPESLVEGAALKMDLMLNFIYMGKADQACATDHKPLNRGLQKSTEFSSHPSDTQHLKWYPGAEVPSSSFEHEAWLLGNHH